MDRTRTEKLLALAAAIAALIGVVVVWWFRPDAIHFRPVTVTELVPLLMPLFVTATFMERAVEVFISVWRGERTNYLEAARDASPEAQRPDAEGALVAYRCASKRVAFKGAFIGGLVLAIAGVRGLTPFLVVEKAGEVPWLFTACDVVLTALVLSGGAEGIHRFVSVVTEFLDATRGRIADSATNQRSIAPVVAPHVTPSNGDAPPVMAATAQVHGASPAA